MLLRFGVRCIAQQGAPTGGDNNNVSSRAVQIAYHHKQMNGVLIIFDERDIEINSLRVKGRFCCELTLHTYMHLVHKTAKSPNSY